MRSIYKFLFCFFILFSFEKSLGQIVINEVYIRPDGSSNTPPNGLVYNGSKEYIELYNAGCVPVDVSGYFVATKQFCPICSPTINSGGTIRIPNLPQSVIQPRGHLVIASANAGGIVTGNVDIQLTTPNPATPPITATAERCAYTGNLVIPNVDGWIALYDAGGNPLDCIYWTGTASNITAAGNGADFNPAGGICLPPGSPSVTLQTAREIFQSKACVVSYIPTSTPTLIYRQTDGAPNWSFYTGFNATTLPSTINKSITGGNCNGGPGSCKVSNPVIPAPVIASKTDVAVCGGTGSVVLNTLPNSDPNNQPPCSNWTVTQSPGGNTSTGNSSSTTISNLAPGNYTFTVTNAGGCVSAASATVTITGPTNCCSVSPASATPSICVNTALATPITHTTNGATGIGTATGLPPGMTPTFNAATNTISISGTPTSVGTGTYNYSIPVTGAACTNINATGTITVLPTNTISLTSAAGTNNQTPCINAAITNITYATTGATGASVAGLPTGVTGNFASNTVTISGTPTASGTFNYTVTLTGGCGNVTATGTITVSPLNTISLSSAVGTNNQTPCINAAITNITYATTGATGATVTGLPTGVTGNFASNTVTISGTPTASGTFNYTVTLTGGCGNIIATGTINVTTSNTISLSSAPGTDNQTPCINAAITNITYATTGATGATVTGLPTGVTGNFASNTVTISGTPTASGVFNYSIPLAGGCGAILNATGTITVTASNTVTAGSSAPSLCVSTPLTNITHTTTGAVGIGTATGLPAGVTASFGSNTITISGTPTAAGTFNYTIPLSGGCGNVTATGTITVSPKPLVPTAAITQQPTCPLPTGGITVSSPTGFNIEYSIDNGTTYQSLPIFSNLAPGNYNIIVRNTSTGCVSDPSSSLTINALPVAPATPTASVTVQPTCIVPTGTVVITAPTGAALEYSVNGINYQTVLTFSGLTPNPYNVTVRNTNTGCVSSPLSLTVNPIPGAPPAPTVGSTNPTCAAPLTGDLTITNPLGPAYQYSINGINYQISPVFAGLTPNTYNVTVREPSTGCTSAVSIGTILPAPPVSPLPTAPLQPEYCVGDVPSGPFAASGINLQWYANPSGGTGSATAPLPNTSTAGQKIYYVTQTITNGCESGRLPVIVEVNPLPIVSAGPDKRINIGESVILQGTALGTNINILWSPSANLLNANTTTPTASPRVNRTYTIKVVTGDGCVGTDDVNVVVIEPINIPNIFSPNGDGLNDLWIIDKIEQYPNAVVEIFNRYGKKIFERKGYSRSSAWDGTNKGAALPVGAYYYILRLGDDTKARTGVISIIR